MEAKSSGGVMGFCLARTSPQVSEGEMERRGEEGRLDEP